jgi:hypothetical protein
MTQLILVGLLGLSAGTCFGALLMSVLVVSKYNDLHSLYAERIEEGNAQQEAA